MPENLDSISISQFKATCLAVLERVRRTGRPVTVTKRGEPIAEIVPPSRAAAGASWMGALRGEVWVLGDIVAPDTGEDWEVVR